ncbi:hypothetical protein HELRODRAFT_160016 [Helobdella robusta]|uniref:Uncharacterized protein n=1 Tax=Helobdella robusta TaxID=6412 RepID=T1EPN9_HELRO|nr:hypothetical protein HELRODRAFT_160016 [Helobdella robusta]ESO05923.1 hypothetical protein HELRODRAFT_160016 [Helobdella robusta]
MTMLPKIVVSTNVGSPVFRQITDDQQAFKSLKISAVNPEDDDVKPQMLAEVSVYSFTTPQVKWRVVTENRIQEVDLEKHFRFRQTQKKIGRCFVSYILSFDKSAVVHKMASKMADENRISRLVQFSKRHRHTDKQTNSHFVGTHGEKPRVFAI